MKTRHLILIGLTILLWFSFRFLLPLTLPFVLAYFFAKLVSPMIQFLVNKLKWRRKVSIFLVVFFTLLILGGFSVYIITLIISQGMMLLQKIPVYGQICGRMLERMCSHCDRMLELADGSSFDYLEGQAAGLYQKIGTDLLPKLSGCAIFLVKKGIGAISSLFIFFLSVLLILLDDKMPAVRGRLRRLCKNCVVPDLLISKRSHCCYSLLRHFWHLVFISWEMIMRYFLRLELLYWMHFRYLGAVWY